MMDTLAPRLRDWTDDLRLRWQDREISPATRQRAFYAFLAAMGAAWGAAVAVAGFTGVLLCVSLIAMAFCLRDFRVGVVLLILLLPISGSAVFPHELFGVTGANPLNLLIAGALGVFLMNLPAERERPQLAPRPLFWLYIVPLVVGGLMGMPHVDEIPASYLHAEPPLIYFDAPPGYIRDVLVKPLLMVLFALLVAAAVHRSRDPRKFIVPVVISMWQMVLLVLGFVLTSGVGLSEMAGTYGRQLLSPLGMHANDLGRLYAVGYALLLFTWDRTTHLGLKSFLFFSMGAVVVGLVLTFSRGAFFGFVVVNLLYLVSRRRMKTLMLAALAVPLFLQLMPGAVWSRLEMGFGEGADAVSAGRIKGIWLPLLPELFDSPVWGKGLNSIMWSRAMIGDLIHNAGHPHNAYLQAYMDLGVIGLALLVAFWVYAWRGFRRLAADPRVPTDLRGFFEGAAAGLASFLIAGMAGSSLYPVPEQSFLWLALGMMWGVKSWIEKKGT